MIRDAVIAPAVVAAGQVSEEMLTFAVTNDERVDLARRLQQLERRFGVRDRFEVVGTGEIYLELEALDLEDEEAILLFANRFGVLGISGEGYSSIRDLPWYADELQMLQASMPPMSATRNPHFGGTRPVTQAETVAEFQFAARVLRDLRAAYICLRDNTVEEMVWQSTSTPPTHMADRSFEIAPGVTDVTTAPHPWRRLALYFEGTLTAGLRVFHPRVTLTEPEHRPAHGWLAGLTVSLFSTCCLELHNHIAEEAVYRRCENDRCNRLFVRQKGRAEAGQHRREGVKYCSNYCARAVAQRKYRERQRRGREKQQGLDLQE